MAAPVEQFRLLNFLHRKMYIQVQAKVLNVVWPLSCSLRTVRRSEAARMSSRSGENIPLIRRPNIHGPKPPERRRLPMWLSTGLIALVLAGAVLYGCLGRNETLRGT